MHKQEYIYACKYNNYKHNFAYMFGYNYRDDLQNDVKDVPVRLNVKHYLLFLTCRLQLAWHRLEVIMLTDNQFYLP